MGAAGRAFLPAIRGHAEFELVALADLVADIRDSVSAETGATGFADLPSMLAGTDLDAIYIATPTELHAGHAGLAFVAGKHVLTEKPMAIRLDEAQAMIAAACAPRWAIPARAPSANSRRTRSLSASPARASAKATCTTSPSRGRRPITGASKAP